jgi:RND family efflux transporter MFP subunit
MKKSGLRSILFIALAVLILGGAAYYFLSPKGKPGAAAADKKEVAPNARPALTVTAAQPQPATLPIRLAANGNITAWQEAVIGSESNGLRLTDVLVNVGDVVKPGQVLATFSTDSTQADVAQARANLLDAQASAADAAANAERARTLQSSGALSQQQINQYLTLEKTARAKAEAAQASLGAQQLRGRQTRVLAPDSGVISSRTATVGSVVPAGTELFKLIRKGRLEWRAEVTSAELGRIQAGMPVTLRPASGGEISGKVRMIAPSVDPQTRSALVYVDLPSMLDQRASARAGEPSPTSAAASGGSEPRASGSVGARPADRPPLGGTAPSAGSAAREATSLGARPADRPPSGGTAPPGGSAVREATSVGAALPGMFARGDFEIGSSTALTVPQRALVVRDGFNYLFTLSPDNRATQVKVQTGRLAGDRVEILGGLTESARIVVDGASFLAEGDLVRIGQAAAEGPANGASAPVAVK